MNPATWNAFMHIVQLLRVKYGNNVNLHELFESFHINFGQWETGIRRTDKECHPHGHINLTLEAIRLAKLHNLNPLIGRRFNPENHMYKDAIDFRANYIIPNEFRDVKTQVSDIKTQVSDLKTQVSDLKTQVSDIEDRVTNNMIDLFKLLFPEKLEQIRQYEELSKRRKEEKVKETKQHPRQ